MKAVFLLLLAAAILNGKGESPQKGYYWPEAFRIAEAIASSSARLLVSV